MFHVKQNTLSIGEESYNEALVTLNIDNVKFSRYFSALEIDEILLDYDSSRRNSCVDSYKKDLEIEGEIPCTVACVLSHVAYCDFVARASSTFLENIPTRRVRTLRKE